MSLRDLVFGRPLTSAEAPKQELSVITGVPVLGLDALASTGYGPEAALTALLPLGVFGLRYYPFIVVAIVLKLLTLYLSYRQTAEAYPNGGGAYVVAKDNLGVRVGVWAAVALLLDYLLNVGVGIAAGVGAVVSAIPALQPHTLLLCLLVLLTLTILNLRGVRESGLVFVVPVFIFVACLGGAMAIGLVNAWHSGGQPHAVLAPPPIPPPRTTPSTWLLLAAFANGCTAMTGIEAVSNGVPLFRPPAVRRAHGALTAIAAILGSFLLGLAWLCPAYHIGAMDERAPGYQTILSQLVAAVAGRGAFYYVSSAAIFVVLTYSAQTSFADFPRVCRLLAEDRFLPPSFANRGRRLVYSHGILVLAILSALLFVVFGGVTDALIPLFAVGAFAAFLVSQIGMVVHWLKKRGPRFRIHLAYNALGAVTTSLALIVIVVAKFLEGAWLTVVFVPALALLLFRIRRHYDRVARQVDEPLALRPAKLQPPAVIVPIEGWNRAAEKALRFGLSLSDDVTAVHVSTEPEDERELRKVWVEKVERPAEQTKDGAVPRLEIIRSPYRRHYEPVVQFVEATKKSRPDRLVAVVIPELAEPHWYEYVLDNLHGEALRALLKGDDRTVVINVPWRLREA